MTTHLAAPHAVPKTGDPVATISAPSVNGNLRQIQALAISAGPGKIQDHGAGRISGANRLREGIRGPGVIPQMATSGQGGTRVREVTPVSAATPGPGTIRVPDTTRHHEATLGLGATRAHAGILARGVTPDPDAIRDREATPGLGATRKRGAASGPDAIRDHGATLAVVVTLVRGGIRDRGATSALVATRVHVGIRVREETQDPGAILGREARLGRDAIQVHEGTRARGATPGPDGIRAEAMAGKIEAERGHPEIEDLRQIAVGNDLPHRHVPAQVRPQRHRTSSICPNSSRFASQV